MQFVVIGYNGTDEEAPARREAARPAHLELGNRLRVEGRHLYGLALMNDDNQVIGSIIVADFEDRDALDRWLAEEPYVTQNVWQRIVVHPCWVGPNFLNKPGKEPD